MPTPPLPPEDLQAALDLVVQFRSINRAAESIDIPAGTLRHRYKLALAQSMTPSKGIVTHPDIDDLPDGQRLKGTSTLTDVHGNQLLQWVKTEEDKKRELEKLKAMVEEFKQDLPQVKHRTLDKKKFNDKLLNLTPMGDPHAGMYSWAPETGNDFDLDIFKKDLCGAVEYLMSQAPECERCIIVNLGDLFHYDNFEGTTTRGTRLDVDSRLPKVIGVGVAAIRQAIEIGLQRHRTVEIINCQGNHDEVLSMALSILLAHVYEKEPRVIVHDEPTPRHYIKHGQVLIGATHGNKIKPSLLPGVMATEQSVWWGQSKYRYFLRGHFHHAVKEKEEFNGCTVEMFRTLAPNDAYNSGGGWLAHQDMQNITYHADYGEVSRVTCSINLLRDLVK